MQVGGTDTVSATSALAIQPSHVSRERYPRVHPPSASTSEGPVTLAMSRTVKHVIVRYLARTGTTPITLIHHSLLAVCAPVPSPHSMSQ